jgi:undecaprenyl-diphosphatase
VVEHRVDALDPLVVALSRLGSFGLIWIFAAAVAAVAWRRPDVLWLTAASVAAADLVALALKTAIGRPRPYVRFPDQEPLLRTAFDYSLPSGHAATSFAAATVLVRFAPRLAPALFPLAAAIAWSRVYVGVHYPSDILLGALLGVAVGLAVAAAAPRARRRLEAARRRSPPPPPPG